MRAVYAHSYVDTVFYIKRNGFQICEHLAQRGTPVNVLEKEINVFVIFKDISQGKV